MKPHNSFDDILLHLGEFGPYQRKIYFLLFIPTIFSAMQKLSWVFLGANVPHRCRLQGELANATFQLETQVESCSYINDQGDSVPCDRGWIYDRSIFGSSAVMDWDLVCENKSSKATAQSLFMLGVLIGSYIFGAISDQFGRKPAFMASVLIQAAFGILSGLAPNYWTFVLARIVIGMTTSGVFLVSYVLAMEMVGPSYRVIAGTLCQYYYTSGFFIIAAMAYYLNFDWQLLQIALTVPTALFMGYWWIMPESVRWLIQKGRLEEAQRQIQHVAKQNGVEEIPEHDLEELLGQNEEHKAPIKNTGLLDLFKTPRLRVRTLNLFFSWFVNSGTYYGLSLNTSNLGGNPYWNFLLSGFVEIPAYALNLLVLNRPFIGRRLALSGCLTVGGLALFATLFIPSDQTGILIGLTTLGKLAITASYGVVYIFSAEIFPTEVRNIGMGASSMCARIGGILCPYLNLLGDYWTALPLIVYGSLALLAGVLALLLPETLNKKLPETLQDGENFGHEE